ncbi:unnamed protein product [Ostreobium quekettii]|uniref:Galactokinase n=1 Tax=Ostreobium quekettii TaxID=121088 RepID=A0A8S1JH51_9CHLO|nr:unnamed protein product [Ostreobium quekettii]|eukprot:evm.model.scf_759EXC.4 EVM.evm.TU.scf_759EXC.4   scf_759EXC:26635-33998(-)
MAQAASDGLVPVVSDPVSIYGQQGWDVEKSRYAELGRKFEEAFGCRPDVLARSPGRVNLIGEHIDYEGYAVFPMAIHQDTVVALRVGGDTLQIHNTQQEQYPAKDFPVDPKQAVDVKQHTWANYFVAAYKGVYDYISDKGMEAPAPSGLQVMIDGRVPTGSGLSSSSALVCASALGVLAVHGTCGLQLKQADIAEFTCRCERYVGTESGGMDQAISIMARPGVAKLVEFNPVRATDVALPPGASFVVANSLAVSNKAETATGRYNLRVVECRLASAVVALKLGLSVCEAVKIETLGQLQRHITASTSIDSFTTCIEAVNEHLHGGEYSISEVGELVGVTLPELFSSSTSSLKVLEAKQAAGKGFKLKDRALHVYSEAKRVHDFKRVCESNEDTSSKLKALGSLMNASHESCRDLYECSCPELEDLVSAALKAGALGSRLTGAGWGGCTVSLVLESKVDAFISEVTHLFYSSKLEQGVITTGQLQGCIFATKPSSGAAVLMRGAER